MIATQRLHLIDRVNPVSRLAAAMLLTTPLLLTVDWVSAARATNGDALVPG